MKIILIAAVSENGFIGKNNKLMWHLPNDLKRFKNITIGETIIMGRKTFESIGKILPKRRNIILSKKIKLLKKNIKILSSIKEINFLSYEKIFIIGGEQIYKATIEIAHIIELTLVHNNFYGDAIFPKIDTKKWKKIYEFFHKKDKYHLYNYSFIRFEKK
ncbi:dihydrofolate reductase [Blattabacterium cuenoti]|uniref:dihydrofolate reductase n=1 Tax=Blattabacterium cuenoti TaxID=1653831 RepID=UPI00163CD507|nr:dihydrofolate reductase [Blattabacterium cuenoti]